MTNENSFLGFLHVPAYIVYDGACLPRDEVFTLHGTAINQGAMSASL